MEGRLKKVIAILIVIIVIASIITSVALLFKPNQSPTPTTFAFRDNDYFLYNIVGTFNGKVVSGNYDFMLIQAHEGFYSFYSRNNFSDPAVEARMKGVNPSVVGLSGVTLVGSGNFDTGYGVKVVQFCFTNHPNGLFEIDCFGIDPFIVYGAFINGPDIHLEYVLNGTNNQFVRINNTAPIIIEHEIFPLENFGTANFGIMDNSTSLAPFYNENGGRLSFNLTGGKMDIYAFSEGNLRSMIEGGTLSYVSQATRYGVDNVTEDLTVPPGNYIISWTYHDTNDSTGTYNWSVVWF